MHVVDVSKMDLNLLLVFDALVRERSVSGAARRLHLTQPAISHALRRMRDLFDDPILVRVGNVMTTTLFAEAVHPVIHRALLDVEQALNRNQKEFHPSEARRHYRVATSDYADLVIVPEIMRAVTRDAPNISIELRAVDGNMHRDLELGVLDLAIEAFLPHYAEIHREILETETMSLAMRKGHPYAENPSFDTWLAYPHVVISTEHAVGAVDEMLKARGHTRRIGLRVPRMLAALEAVAMSDLLAILPSALLEAARHVRPIEVLPAPFDTGAIEIEMIWHRRASTDPSLDWLKGLIRDASHRLSQAARANHSNR
jgi:DNA-binding transcriptional LysR family regulator